MIEIREAKPHHVGQIVRRMRSGHVAAIAALGINAHRDLKQVFDSSVYRKAAFAEGRLEALWGVTGMMASGSGHVWFVLSKEGEGYPMEVASRTRKELASILETRTELTTTIFDGDDAAYRFALIFGFRPVARRSGMTWMRLRRDMPVSHVGIKNESPFLIFGLPRSRTTWLSEFLSYGSSTCIHDAMLEVNGWSGMRKLLSQPNTGICETGFVMAWPVLKRYFPKARFMVVRRRLDEVKRELATFGWNFAEGHLEWMAKRLEEISALPGSLTVTFDGLNREEVCREAFQHCLQQPFDRNWWLYWKDRDVQIDMAERMRRLAQRSDAMQRLVNECDDLMLPVSYRVETMTDLMRDGQEIFAEHIEEVGEFNEMEIMPNFDRALALEKIGKLQVMVARAGKQIVGYLLFIIDDHPESKVTKVAVQIPFFVTKAFRGIGPRLHNEARKALKNRGVEVLSLSAGMRGSGPKLAQLYKRLGAIEERRVFSLRI